jgi:hypothetical protein
MARCVETADSLPLCGPFNELIRMIQFIRFICTNWSYLPCIRLKTANCETELETARYPLAKIRLVVLKSFWRCRLPQTVSICF